MERNSCSHQRLCWTKPNHRQLCGQISKLAVWNILPIISKSESVSSSVMPDSATIWTVAHFPGKSGFPGKNTGLVAIFFSRGFSWPRNQTLVSCAAGRFLTVWAMWEAPTKNTPSEETWTFIQIMKMFKEILNKKNPPRLILVGNCLQIIYYH